MARQKRQANEKLCFLGERKLSPIEWRTFYIKAEKVFRSIIYSTEHYKYYILQKLPCLEVPILFVIDMSFWKFPFVFRFLSHLQIPILFVIDMSFWKFPFIFRFLSHLQIPILCYWHVILKISFFFFVFSLIYKFQFCLLLAHHFEIFFENYLVLAT